MKNKFILGADIQKYLIDLQYEDIQIELIDANIEDCFMALMKASDGE